MTSVRVHLVRGLVSGLLHEAVVVVLSFASMLALVRLLTPEQFGQAAAAVGVLAFIGAFRGAMFVEHALQHGKDVEPDWDQYFTVVGIVQLTLCAVTVLTGFAFRFWETFAAVGPLVQIAALGFLLEWPAQVASVKLRRELRFDRLKVLSSISALVRLGSAVVLAWWGLGALALVISANVLSAAPLAFSFLFLERWRPRANAPSFPSLAAVRPMLQFGAQQIAVGFLQSLRTAAESLVLATTFGVATFGLLNRAQALYQSTVGRLGLVFVDTAYPLLPLEQGDAKRYAHRASRFLEAALILSIPGAVFIALEGASVSRVLYGAKWVDADPYLAAAAIAVAAGNLVSTGGCIAMGMGHTRSMLIAEATASIGGIAALASAMLVPNPTAYLWVVASTQVLAAALALRFAAPFLERDWQRRGLWPAAAASVGGAVAVLIVRTLSPLAGAPALVLSATAFATVATAILAATARPLVLEVVRTRKVLVWRGGAGMSSQARA